MQPVRITLSALRLLCVSCLLTVTWTAVSRAQLNGSDQSSQQNCSSTQGQAGFGGIDPTATGCSGQSGGASFGAGTGQSSPGLTQTVPYSPAYIANPGSQSAPSTPRESATDKPPGAPGSTQPSQALYVKPGSSPGQFQLVPRPPPAPNEFEAFVDQSLGRRLARFASSLTLPGARGFTTPPTTTVPPDYRLNPGDELIIGVTGSVEANLSLTIDSEGRIFIPKIGAINVGGIRYGDLADAMSRRFADQYRQARLSVSIGHLHGITIYVTGYAASPGAYTVSSLTTVTDAILTAGGPSGGGSFRSIEVRRAGQLVTTLDLYDLLMRGDKSHDVVLQNGDVINVAPSGPEIAIAGSVNSEAIFEIKRGETLGDIIGFAGGLNSLADSTRVVIQRLADADTTGMRQIDFVSAKDNPAEGGELVRVLSVADITRPRERQAVLVTIEGEVDHPGRYFMKPGTTVADLVAQAGGLTDHAFAYGTTFQRDSIRADQQTSFDKAIDSLEVSAAAEMVSSLNGPIERAATSAPKELAVEQVIERLKQHRPDGRLVLDIAYGAGNLPGALSLENNDRIFIPPRPVTVGVFGAVYQTGSFAFNESGRIRDYLAQAGGEQRYADRGAIFVVRANGSVISSRVVHDLRNHPAQPGDVIFVPVRTSSRGWQKLLDVAAIVYQFGIGALTIKALTP